MQLHDAREAARSRASKAPLVLAVDEVDDSGGGGGGGGGGGMAVVAELKAAVAEKDAQLVKMQRRAQQVLTAPRQHSLSNATL